MFKTTLLSSTRALTKKEEIMVKDLADSKSLDEVITTDNPSITIKPVAYHTLEIDTGDKTYKKYVIECEDGNRYVTGSETFMNSFTNIFADMCGYNEEEWGIKCFKQDSKNYKGKQFLTCCLV